MKIDSTLIYGVYELRGIKEQIDGKPTTETVTAGMFTFTRDNRLAVVSGSNEYVMAYAGRFEIKDDCLYIHTESCSIREREGTTMTRKIIKLDGKNLVLGLSYEDYTKYAELTWEKVASL